MATATSFLALLAALQAPAEPGTVVSQSKISASQGGLVPPPEKGDGFGHSLAAIGDLNGDGVPDLVVGDPYDDVPVPDPPWASPHHRGSIRILFMDEDGSIGSIQEINQLEGGFVGAGIEASALFGHGVAALGDVDGDGITDLAVGAPGQQDVLSQGVVHVLFLEPDGTVRDEAQIPGFQSGGGESFGEAVAGPGDLDGDGVPDLVVGAPGFHAAGAGNGAVYVVLLQADGGVKSWRRITEGESGFSGPLGDYAHFGASVAVLGDVDGDGAPDLAVGAPDAEGAGDAWILRMHADGSVKAETAVSKAQGGFAGTIGDDDVDFGRSVTAIGDINGDLVPDVAIGAPFSSEGSAYSGSLWICTLRAQGTVMTELEISELSGGFTGDGELLGYSAALLGDLSGDGWRELAVGNVGDDDGGVSAGAVYVLSLQGTSWTAAYGCASPEESFVAQGVPALGSTLELRVDNPFGTQGAGSLPLVVVSLAPDPAHPCGTQVPGLGMAGGGASGELLIDPSAIVATLSGEPWSGPGTPGLVELPVPPATGLLGLSAFAQALLVDPDPGAPLPLALGGALELVLGV